MKATEQCVTCQYVQYEGSTYGYACASLKPVPFVSGKCICYKLSLKKCLLLKTQEENDKHNKTVKQIGRIPGTNFSDICLADIRETTPLLNELNGRK